MSTGVRRIAAATLDLGDGVGFRVLIQKGRAVGSSGEVQLRSRRRVGGRQDRAHDELNDIDEACAAAERLAQERADG
jgi:hypothetical protein